MSSLTSQPAAQLETDSSTFTLEDTPLAPDLLEPNLETTPSIERVSVTNEGAGSIGFSSAASLSADGRYVAFSSNASDLVEGDTNAENDIFVRDRLLNTTERISIASDGSENIIPAYNPTLSADGRYVAFQSNGVFVYDRQTETIEQVAVDSKGSLGIDLAGNADISADGQIVAFSSIASNLVEDDTNDSYDIFVRDRLAGSTQRISISSEGEQSNGNSDVPALSANGQFVVFTSNASNLVEGDTNNSGDVFLYDRDAGTLERISVSTDGTEGDGYSSAPSISADGRYVSFSSSATNLVSGDENEIGDIFVRDRLTQTTERINLNAAGTEANNFSFNHGISADGRYISYSSVATNLVENDLNRARDVFVYDRLAQTTERISVSAAGVGGTEGSRESVFSADGRFIAFQSRADNLIEEDNNGRTDIFVYSLSDSTEFIDPELPTLEEPIGTAGQTSENKLVNLKDMAAPTVRATIEVTRDAGYDNTVGFYVVEDELGGVIDSITGEVLMPGDAGYQKAALSRRVSMDFTGTNGEVVSYTTEIATGSLLSTFIVSDGTVESMLDADAMNDPAVFFAYSGANSDRTNHVQLLGANTFGYEDLLGGGDMDFNDMVVQLSFE